MIIYYFILLTMALAYQKNKPKTFSPGFSEPRMLSNRRQTVRGLVCILPRPLWKKMAARFGLTALKIKAALFISRFHCRKVINYKFYKSSTKKGHGGKILG